MREIKYRIPWFNAKGVFQGFTYWGRVDNHEAFSSECFTSPGQWGNRRAKPDEQFTGLRDKNGKDIYEGDIVTGEKLSDGQYDILIVAFENKTASFVLTKKGWAFCHYFHESINGDECEVVGNIHENPELLTGHA